MTENDSRPGELSPREFVRRMPEGQSAGPGAPETIEPTTGRADGPGGPAMRGLGEGGEGKTAASDATPDARGTAGFVAYVTQLGAGALTRLRGRGR